MSILISKIGSCVIIFITFPILLLLYAINITPIFISNTATTEKDIKREKKKINKIRLIRPRSKALGIQFKEGVMVFLVHIRFTFTVWFTFF